MPGNAQPGGFRSGFSFPLRKGGPEKRKYKE